MSENADLNEILGRKWSKKLMYLLEEGEKSFSELKKSGQISSRALSYTLKFLVKRKIVRRRLNEDRTTSYSLTNLGLKIVKLLHELNEVGEKVE